MTILASVLPVFIMLAIGVFIKRTDIITKEGMAGIKTLVINIMFPVVFVNALGTVPYSLNTVIVLLIMFSVLLIAMGIGILLRPVFKFGKYLPAILTTFEGGMLAYPLFISMRGAGRMAEVVTVDLAQCIFAGTGFIILAHSINASGKKPSVRDITMSLVKTPFMWGIIIGIVLGATGVLPRLIATPAGAVYSSVVNMITQPVSALILVSVGYDFRLEGSVLGAAAKSIAIRLALMMVMLFIVVQIFRAIGVYEELRYAILLYMFMPPFFAGPMFIDDDEGRALMSTAISMYIIVTLVAYTVLTVLFATSMAG